MAKTQKKDYILNSLFYFTLTIYIVLLFTTIIFKTLDSPLDLINGSYIHYRKVNLDPYIWDIYMTDYLNKINILGNVILFIPLPIFYRALSSKNSGKFFKSIFLSLFLSIFFEIFQFVFEIGVTDINDIILNTLGGIIGTIIYSLISLLLSKDKIKEFISIFGGTITFTISILIALIKIVN